MTWYNHKLTAFGLTYVVTDNILFSLFVAVASVLPDTMEFITPARHRGIFHSPLFWVITFLMTYFTLFIIESRQLLYDYEYLINNSFLDYVITALNIDFNIYAFMRYIVDFIFTGTMLHLLTDSFSVFGVPLFRGKRLGLKLYKTFTFSEAYVTASIIVPCILVVLFRKGIL